MVKGSVQRSATRRGTRAAMGDVDLNGRALSIVETLTTVSHRVHIGRPTTGKSRRRVSLDAVTFDALRVHRIRQLEERLAVASRIYGTK